MNEPIPTKTQKANKVMIFNACIISVSGPSIKI